MAGLATIDGVKDQGAVRFLAHGGAGIAPGGQIGDNSSVFRQTVERADGILYISQPSLAETVRVSSLPCGMFCSAVV